MINITSIESDDNGSNDNETDFTVPAFLKADSATTTEPVVHVDRGMEPKPRAQKPAKAEKPAKAPKAAKVAKEKPAKVAKPKAEKKPAQPSKVDDLVAMLKKAKGASNSEIAEAFGWLPHTTRAAVSTLPKKKQMPEGFTLSSEKDEKRGRVYRLVKVEA